MTRAHDVIIVGGGPAGIFAARELAERSSLDVLLLEKGPPLDRRDCPRSTRGCALCAPCRLLSGWGGAGAFSDGKLTLTPDIGGSLGDYLDRTALEALIRHVDQIYLDFGAPDRLYGTDPGAFRDLQRQAASADLIFVPAPVRHLGTEVCAEVLKALHERLRDRVDIRTGTRAEEILVENGAVHGVRVASGETFRSRYVVVVPGREGAEWFRGQARGLGIGLDNNPVDIGVRVELPAVVLQHLTDPLYEAKLIYYSRAFDDQVRVFCLCPHGEVVVENTGGLLTVNGHSYATRKTEWTNFALLVAKTFTRPFDRPIDYGKYVASLANMLAGGVLVQRLGDLRAGRRSTEKRLAKGVVRPTLPEATPGDLSLVLPYRHLVSILEMLEALDRIAPGVNSRHTLLYGVEVKFYSSRVDLSPALETKVRGLYAAGDGAGVTRGLVQASASGVHVARQILCREGLAAGGEG
ncbi:MAG: NAD(P)/FAD-dependent oxidoreductase [bacterium]|nr:NAD(P)/FAD-dependent oxidoreductase [bacterium]